jgi:tRNA modification GTPase
MINLLNLDTITALSTAPGLGAIAVIRVSGPEAIAVCDSLFSRSLSEAKSHSLHYGDLKDGDKLLDEVVIALFRGPNSYTGEDTIEISCHGSPFIQREIIAALLDRGIRLADPGEFTMRAFANGKMDLSQAEAVADLIASESAAAHDIALKQLRGGFSKEIAALRERLIHFASLIELELDFAEEDVEFADRQDLKKLVDEIKSVVKALVDSFATGNVVKSGVPVAILGAPNMGKSTLLNALLNEDRAIVSEIAGTTRDTIEDSVTIDGIQFRFIDTAGIRDTEDTIETIGIERAWEKARDASVVLYMVDATTVTEADIIEIENGFRTNVTNEHTRFILIGNKADTGTPNTDLTDLTISAKSGEGLDELKNYLSELIASGLNAENSIVTNARHYEALSKALASLIEVRKGLNNNITGDFLAIDIRKALHHLGEITGVITTEDLLGNIFSKFCIGK